MNKTPPYPCGHERTPENSYVTYRGPYRQTPICRQCRMEKARARYQAKTKFACGHAMNDDNVIRISEEGLRRCKICYVARGMNERSDNPPQPFLLQTLWSSNADFREE